MGERRCFFEDTLTAMDGGNAGNAGAVASKRAFEPGERQYTDVLAGIPLHGWLLAMT